MEQTQKPHVAILPSPGMGHLIPIVEFAKKLLHYNFSITLIVPTDGPISKQQIEFLEALPPGISHILLPPVNFDDLPDDVKIEVRISLTVVRSLPSLRHVFVSLLATEKLVALFVDLFGTDAFDVANEFKVSTYVFYPSTAMMLSFFLYLPELDQKVSCEYRDMPVPVQIPGCIPVHGKDLLDPVQDRKNDAYRWLLHHTKRYRLAEGIVVNSFMDLEGGAIKSLQEEDSGKAPVYPVGPLVQTRTEVEESECLKWLDEQPSNSVLFISFGSGGTLSYDQLTELALGLELSAQRFIWVVRTPNDKVANATYFGIQNQNNSPDFLPQGFLDRTKENGLVVPSWAPQAQILSHGSTGGFLTHCGWNSTLESVVNAVPLIAWPLYAEQRANAVSLTEDLKVALRPKLSENGLVGRLEIAKIVKSLMEGEEGKRLRCRMRDLKEAAAKALSPHGSSTKSLNQLAQKLRNKISASN